MGIRNSRLIQVSCALLLTVWASQGLAADLYVDLNLRNSFGQGSAGGEQFIDGGGANLDGRHVGSDTDTSPVMGGALGIDMPLSEIFPLRDPKVPVPKWTMRFEIEGLGFRDYELKTFAVDFPNDPFNSELSSWSLLHNLWLDIPLYQPMSEFFQMMPWSMPRVPFLRPVSFNTGVGIGVAGLTLKTSDNNSRGSATQYNFSYQAGAGLDYALTRRVTMAVQYRYVDMGETAFDLNGASSSESNFKMHVISHEIGFTVRVNYRRVPFPGVLYDAIQGRKY